MPRMSSVETSSDQNSKIVIQTLEPKGLRLPEEEKKWLNLGNASGCVQLVLLEG